jgi:hypothetical protein
MARFEVTGRKPGTTNLLPIPSKPAAKLAFSIAEFCSMHGISRAHFYNLKKLGLGPLEMNCGGRRLISIEAASDWRRQLERTGGSSA